MCRKCACASYILPPLNVTQHILPADQETVRNAGLLFAEEASSLMDRRSARRASIGKRVQECAALINASKDRWLVWVDLNDEGTELTRLIDGAVEVAGCDDADVKEARLLDFAEGRTRVLVTKASIAGFGLNMQCCHHMAFVGITDSFEAYHQAVRRCWRFGQKMPVDVHVFASEVEGAVVRNLERKQMLAEQMAEELSVETRDAVRSEVRGLARTTNEYLPTKETTMPAWLKGA